MHKGIALVLTTIIVSLAMAAVFGAAGIFISGLVASQNIERSTIAFYVADAGIEAELYRDRIVSPGLADGATCPGEIPVDNDICLASLTNGGVYMYDVQGNVGAPRVVRSTGTFRGVKRTIEINY